MSAENVAIVRRAFDAYERGDIATVLSLCAEDIVVTQAPGLLPDDAPRRYGHDGVLEAFASWPEQWDDFEIGIERIVADPGDNVVVAIRESGRGKQSGVSVDAGFTFVFVIPHGQISEWQIFGTEDEAMASVEGGR